MDRPHRTHSDLLSQVVESHRVGFSPTPVFVEVGVGATTPTMARLADSVGAIAFSCDINATKVARLQEVLGSPLDGVRFLIGDSLGSLSVIARDFGRIDLLFLDGAASALQTFREFQTCEEALGTGSVLVIDNAALPGETRHRSPARKGKILVPYLMASPWWSVSAFPDAGDSMVVALRTDRPDHADPDYESPDYEDPWERQLEKLRP